MFDKIVKLSSVLQMILLAVVIVLVWPKHSNIGAQSTVATKLTDLTITGEIDATNAAVTNATVTNVTSTNVAATNATITGSLNVIGSGYTTVQNLIQGGGVNSITTTSAAYTLATSDVANYSLVNFTASNTTTVVTLPATSTMLAAAGLAINGQFGDVNFCAPASSTVLAAPTGVTLLVSSSSTVAAGKCAQLRFLRDSSTTYKVFANNNS